MDLVDEEDVVLLQVGEDGGQVLGLFQHRPRGRAQVDAELVGDDVAERGLAQPGRAEQQHVVHRFAAHLRRADEDLELLARLRLADVFGQPLGTQRPLDRSSFGDTGAVLTTRTEPVRGRSGRAANSSVWMLII
jgi:hypothetical protein